MKDKAIHHIIIFIMLSLAIGFLCSCSESEQKVTSTDYRFTPWAVDSNFKIDKTKDIQVSIEWGVVDGDYFGTPDSAAKFMDHAVELHAGQPTTATRLNGQTLFVRVTSVNDFSLLLSKNDEKETSEHSVSKAILIYK